MDGGFVLVPTTIICPFVKIYSIWNSRLTTRDTPFWYRLFNCILTQFNNVAMESQFTLLLRYVSIRRRGGASLLRVSKWNEHTQWVHNTLPGFSPRNLRRCAGCEVVRYRKVSRHATLHRADHWWRRDHLAKLIQFNGGRETTINHFIKELNYKTYTKTKSL